MSKEFFKSNELRKDQEFKEFKAEEYRPRDINKTAAENYKTSEFSDHSANKVKKEKNIIQKLIQKVTESASSYAGSLAVTATVLVTTVVVMTGLITSAPKIEILELDSDIDEVSYNILLEDLDENTDYKVLITNNIVDYQYQLVEGENQNTVKNLPSGYLYTLKIIGKNGNEEVVYLSTSFYTISPTKETYTIIFMDGDVILEEKQYEYGEIPTYSEIPTKEKDDKYTYEFIGWDKDITEVTQDNVYYAKWRKILNTYTVSFIVEGEIIQTEDLEYGSLPIYKGEIPTKDAEEQETYEFIGWDKDITEVTQDTIYTAVFKKVTEKYTVSFMVDNITLQTEELEYGVLPTYKGNVPTKDATQEFSYEFIGWDKDITEVKGDVVYTAKFKEIKNKYTISFVVEGQTIQTEELEYGVLPTYKGNVPTKEEEGKIYIFTGWDSEIVNVTGDKIYTAIFTVEGEKFAISFMVEGEILQIEELEYGVLPTYKSDTPYKEGTSEFDYEFVGWSPEIEKVTKNQVYEALFNTVEHAFRGNINDFTSSDVEVEWGANLNTIHINTGFDNRGDERISYRLILFNDDYQVEEVYTGQDAIATLTIPSSIPYVAMKYEIFGVYLDVEEILESKDIYTQSGEYDLIYFDGPVFSLSNEELNYVGQNEYTFDYEIISDYPDEESIKDITIVFDYIYDDDKTRYSTKTLTRRNSSVNETLSETFELPADVAGVTIHFTVNINGRYGGNQKTITYSETLNVPSYLNLNDILVDRDYGKMYLNGEYSLVRNQVIVIEALDTPREEITTFDTLPAELYISGAQSYRYFIGTLNAEGGYEVINEPVMITLESNVTGDYNFSYKNPRDVLLTYNDDNTYNIYINGEFSSDDPDIYWMIMLNNTYPGYSTQNQVLVVEDIPDDTYGLTYHVYKEVNNIKYSIKHASVSGTIGEAPYYNLYFSPSEADPLVGSIIYTMSSDIFYLKENIYAVIKDASGQETTINCLPEDIVETTDTYEVVITLSVTNGFSEGKLYLNMNGSNIQFIDNNSYETISQLVNVKGNKYKTYELEIS